MFKIISLTSLHHTSPHDERYICGEAKKLRMGWSKGGARTSGISSALSVTELASVREMIPKAR